MNDDEECWRSIEWSVSLRPWYSTWHCEHRVGRHSRLEKVNEGDLAEEAAAPFPVNSMSKMSEMIKKIRYSIRIIGVLCVQYCVL